MPWSSAALLVVEEVPVPRLDPPSGMGLPVQVGEHGQLGVRLGGEPGHDGVVELLDRLGPLRHLDLHGEVRPGRVTEQAGDVQADGDGLLQQRPVGLGRPVPELVLQVAAGVAIGGLLHERDVVGIVHRHPVPAVLGGLQPVEVTVGEPVEPGTLQLQPVLPLGEIAIEGDLQLDQPVLQPLQLGAGGVVELVPGAPEVTQPVVEQPAAGAFERGGPFGVGVGDQRLVDRAAEGEVGGPLVEAFLGLAGGDAHLRVGVHLRHEGSGTAGVPDHGDRPLEGGEGVGGVDGGDQGVRLGDRLVGEGGHRRRGDRGEVERHDDGD